MENHLSPHVVDAPQPFTSFLDFVQLGGIGQRAHPLMVRPRSHRLPVACPIIVLLLGDMFQELAGDRIKDVAARDPMRTHDLDRPRKVWQRVLRDGLDVHTRDGGVCCWLLTQVGKVEGCGGRRMGGVRDPLGTTCDIKSDGVRTVAMVLEVRV